VEFLDELRTTYNRIADGPLKYQELRGGIRRALLRRFPYAVYFAIEADIVVFGAVLHASRDPAEWQRRRDQPTAAHRHGVRPVIDPTTAE
jgi:toxin ParE1/3/4